MMHTRTGHTVMPGRWVGATDVAGTSKTWMVRLRRP